MYKNKQQNKNKNKNKRVGVLQHAKHLNKSLRLNRHVAQCRTSNASHMNKEVVVDDSANSMYSVTGHNWKNLTVPDLDFEKPLGVGRYHIEEGMFTAGDHKIDPEVNASDVLLELSKRRTSGIQPAGPASVHRLTAATCLTVEDAVNDFSNVPSAWRCCLMGKGLLFQRATSSEIFVSYGAQTWAWAGVKMTAVQNGSLTYYVFGADFDATKDAETLYNFGLELLFV